MAAVYAVATDLYPLKRKANARRDNNTDQGCYNEAMVFFPFLMCFFPFCVLIAFLNLKIMHSTSHAQTQLNA